MSLSLTFTQDDLDNLKEALISGADEVQIGDRRVKFKSRSEILELINLITTSMNGVTAASAASSFIQATFDKKGKRR
jgi:hypothetical protein